MRTIELRRHGAREKGADALSAQGRASAEDVGRGLSRTYAFVFVSPAKRSAETLAWFLRGSGQPLPPHAVEPGLLSDQEGRWREAGRAAGSSRLDALMQRDPALVDTESKRLAGVIRDLFQGLPPDACALAVGHSPLIEAAVFGLLGVVIEPLGECEGILLALDDAGNLRLEELRLG